MRRENQISIENPWPRQDFLDILMLIMTIIIAGAWSLCLLCMPAGGECQIGPDSDVYAPDKSAMNGVIRQVKPLEIKSLQDSMKAGLARAANDTNIAGDVISDTGADTLEEADTNTVTVSVTNNTANEPVPDIDGDFQPSDSVPLDHDLQLVLYREAAIQDIPYTIALGLIQTESSFNINALNSKTDCYGLCQINPAYWPSDLTPAGNITCGMEILRMYLDDYDQNMDAALTAYNAGYDTGDRVFADSVNAYAAAWAEALGLE